MGLEYREDVLRSKEKKHIAKNLESCQNSLYLPSQKLGNQAMLANMPIQFTRPRRLKAPSSYCIIESDGTKKVYYLDSSGNLLSEKKPKRVQNSTLLRKSTGLKNVGGEAHHLIPISVAKKYPNVSINDFNESWNCIFLDGHIHWNEAAKRTEIIHPLTAPDGPMISSGYVHRSDDNPFNHSEYNQMIQKRIEEYKAADGKGIVTLQMFQELAYVLRMEFIYTTGQGIPINLGDFGDEDAYTPDFDFDPGPFWDDGFGDPDGFDDAGGAGAILV